MHSLLHHSSDLEVNRVQILTVWWPQICSDEIRSLATQKFDRITCKMRRCAVLLKDVHIVCDMTDGWQKFLRQQYVPLILPVHFDTWLDEHETRTVQLGDSHRDHDELAEGRSRTQEASSGNLAFLCTSQCIDAVIL